MMFQERDHAADSVEWKFRHKVKSQEEESSNVDGIISL